MALNNQRHDKEDEGIISTITNIIKLKGGKCGKIKI